MILIATLSVSPVSSPTLHLTFITCEEWPAYWIRKNLIENKLIERSILVQELNTCCGCQFYIINVIFIHFRNHNAIILISMIGFIEQFFNTIVFNFINVTKRTCGAVRTSRNCACAWETEWPPDFKELPTQGYLGGRGRDFSRALTNRNNSFYHGDNLYCTFFFVLTNLFFNWQRP